MSLDHLIVRDVEGERKIGADSLPLKVGTGSDCAIRLPGPGGEPGVLLDILDDAPFVQPAGRNTAVRVGGEPLTGSRRLGDGDELSFYGSRVTVSREDDSVVFEVHLEDSAYVTRPPGDAAAGKDAGDETIAPSQFRRAADTAARAAARERNTLRYVVAAGLAVLLGLSWLLFTSKSIRFDIEPAEPDRFDIEGGWFRLPLGDRILLREGEYTLELEKDGYFDVRQTFVVDEAPNKVIEVEMRKRPGTVTVTTLPPSEATVTIDGSRIGKAPYGPIELEPGEHSLSVRAERFLPYEGVIDFPGLGRHREISVQLVPRWAEVTIRSEPPGATVLVGEEALGETPLVARLLEGRHSVSVVLDGYKAWDGMVATSANEARTLPLIELEAADARLLVNTIPRGANVTVNGRYRGLSPVTLDLAPGVDYQIGLSKVGYGSTNRQVRLESAASESITVDLTARTGTVTVNVEPADATVYVDGNARGTGSTTLNLSAAPHTIEVRKPGHESWSRNVTPRPGYPQTLTARLRTLEAVAAAKIERTAETVLGQQLRRVDPGTFTMGSSRGEQGRRANEVIVPVTLTQPFFISVHEVTNKAFANFDPSHDSGASVHAAMAGDNNPVANVSWAEAVRFCNYLSEREGLTPVYREQFGEWVAIRPFPNGYRLPTEAEWAWAVRYSAGGRAPTFPWGERWPPPPNSGNYADRAAADLVKTVILSYDDGFKATAPVGQFPPNPLGLHDGGGNVAEWVNDYYTVPTPGLTEAVIDPLGPERGTTRVIRGSSWRHGTITELRLAYRDYGSEPRTDVGFRIVRNIE